MTWAWREAGPRATGAAVLVLVGLVLLVQAFEPPEGDCQGAHPRDSSRNPVCIGPLTQAWQVALVAVLAVGAFVAAGVVWWRGRAAR